MLLPCCCPPGSWPTGLIASVCREGPEGGKAPGIFSAVSGPAMTLGPLVGGAALFAVGTAVGVAVLALPYGAGAGTMLLVAAAPALVAALLPVALRGTRASLSPSAPTPAEGTDPSGH
ncbi:hypothetical protein [Nonomuraea rhizosphaerae]|uniref:hypothetical protein n=1 Tax=Nonomuraea rhizosphaerae TaxID=2665663 RepID=UPI001C5DAE68|nr:hypothetical protein [Nonomuraea rhizosphaerae]